MTPDEIKSRIRDAYEKARKGHGFYRPGSSRIENLIRELKLYGREAGADFVETNIHLFVDDAVDKAEARAGSTQFTVNYCGRAAVEGMAETLRERTGLQVDVKSSSRTDVSSATVTLTWAAERTEFV